MISWEKPRLTLPQIRILHDDVLHPAGVVKELVSNRNAKSIAESYHHTSRALYDKKTTDAYRSQRGQENVDTVLNFVNQYYPDLYPKAKKELQLKLDSAKSLRK